MRECEHVWEPLGVGRRCIFCGLEEFEFTEEQLRITELLRAPDATDGATKPVPEDPDRA